MITLVLGGTRSGKSQVAEALAAEAGAPVTYVATGRGHPVWQSPATLRGSYPTTDGGANLAWAAGDRLIFLADLDGWTRSVVPEAPVPG